MRLTLHLLVLPVLFGFFFTGLMSCTGGTECRAPQGRWSNREGQEIVFNPGSKGMWLSKFGSRYDTALFEYELLCKLNPIGIDLRNFRAGPFIGKTLLGILEWTSDTTFRLRFEAGTDPALRPTSFDPDQTVSFFKQQE